MDRRAAQILLPAFCGVAVVAGPSHSIAQTGTPVSLQASALFVGLSGDAYAGSEGGVGTEGQVRYNFVGLISVGVGVQYSRHSFAESVGLADPLTLFGFFLEPRYVVSTRYRRLAPYVSGRLALLRQSTNIQGTPVRARGTQLNAGGGLLLGVAPSMNIDVGATLGVVSFGDYNTGAPAGSGKNWVLRTGVSLAVGR